jgi:hypothetical protein
LVTTSATATIPASARFLPHFCSASGYFLKTDAVFLSMMAAVIP